MTGWWLRYAILVAGIASGLLLIVVSRFARRAGLVIASLAGPTAYAVSTARTPHTGSIPSSGPASTGGFGSPGGGRPGGGGGGVRFGGQPPTGGFPRGTGTAPTGRGGCLQRRGDLSPCVRRLHEHLERFLPYEFLITIANASTDATPQVARRLADELPSVRHVRHVRLEQKGRGRALNAVWLASEADVVAYLDVDLSTDLNALLPLVAPLISGHSDIAIGSRLSQQSRVVRGAKREVISRSYNLILGSTLLARFSDAQCGFKAMRADVGRQLLPLVQDTGWFFDTELLVLAERSGLRIHEVAVDWVDDPDSRVDLLSTAMAGLRGVVRVGRALAAGALPLAEVRAQLGRQLLTPSFPDVPPGLLRQLVRFDAIGALSTTAYLVLFWPTAG